MLFIAFCLEACFLSQIPTVNSYREMPSRRIQVEGESALLDKGLVDISSIEVDRKKKLLKLPNFIENSNTSAFLIFQKGKLIYEWYDEENFSEQQIHPSFSLAKSITSALVGIAIEEGKIHSVHDKVIRYLPELDSAKFHSLEILHLLQMTSGIRYSELEVFHTEDAHSLVKRLKPKFTPGEKHEYWSTITQLLGLVLQKAIAPQNISSYLSEKVWIPMGAEYPASWTVDHDGGIEKTFCCIQATARDFMRFGLIYLNDGYYNGKQIVPKEWIQESIAINEEEGSVKKYNYGWWFPSEKEKEYMARGFKGQYVFINKEKQSVIVRLGKNRDGLYGFKWSGILSQINQQL